MALPANVHRPARLLALALSLGLAPAARAQEPGTDRAPDGLLERPDLQAVVDLQVARDGVALVDRLNDLDPAIRARAAFALASVQDRAAVPALVEALGDEDPRVRSDAAYALGQSADSSAAGALLDALAGEPDAATRARLYEAVGKVGDAAALERLAALESPDAELPSLALAIARIGLRGVFHPAAAGRLGQLLAHEEAIVREAAAYPLGRWREAAPWAEAAGAAVRAAVDDAYTYQAGGRGTVAPAGPAPEMHLIAALGKLGDAEDTPRLKRWLEDGVDWRARVSAARALGSRAGEAAAREALVAALTDPSTHVAVAAAAALAAADSLPDDTVHEVAVRTTLYRSEWHVSAEALPVLARAGVEAFVILWLMWLDAGAPDNVAARAKALRALGEGSKTPGFLVLEDEAGWENPRVAAASVAGLRRRWERGVVSDTASAERYFRAFARALARRDIGTVSEAAPALADSAFRSFGATDSLIAAYRALELPRDLEAMMAILDALGRSRDPAARPLLEEVTRHPELALGRAAAAALGASTGQPVEVAEAAERAERAVDWSALAELGPRPRLVLDTEKGRIVVVLDAEQAPLTVQTVTGLAREGRYDGVPFHRVVPNFVVQGGDFERGDGYGGPGFEIVSEFTRIPYVRGAIGMASAGKDTEGSQYFLTHSIQPHLDGRYTAFGIAVQGGDVLDALLESDRLVRATVEPGSVAGARDDQPRPEGTQR